MWRYPLWRNLETQNVFALGPLGGVLWAFQILPFLAYLQFLNNHILASTNDRRLVLESNIKFWNELSEKICEIFFGPKTPCHIHIKFMLESTRETLGIDLYEGALHF